LSEEPKPEDLKTESEGAEAAPVESES